MALTSGSSYQFRFGTSAEYAALSSVNDGYFYVLTDTKQIYVGSDLYTGSVEFVTEFPTSPAQGTIYVNTETQETRVWNGSAWVVIVPAISTTLTSTTDDASLVTAAGIRDYIASAITDAVDGAVVDVSYDSTTGDFTFTAADGTTKTVNTPVENFLSAASFDATTNILTLTLNDQTTVTVDLTDLIDVYTVENTGTINMSITDNVISGSVNKSATEGNALQILDDGLYVDLSDYVTTDSLNTTLADYATTTYVDDGLAEKADADDVYTKDEVDALLTWKTLSEE